MGCLGEVCFQTKGDQSCGQSLRHYFSEPVLQQKTLGFNTLTKGNDLVWEYAHKFLVLERYSLGSLANEKACASEFSN